MPLQWGRMQLGSDGLNRRLTGICPFYLCIQGDKSQVISRDFKGTLTGFASDVNRVLNLIGFFTGFQVDSMDAD